MCVCCKQNIGYPPSKMQVVMETGTRCIEIEFIKDFKLKMQKTETALHDEHKCILVLA